ncbi:MAG: TIGR02206 family membrane protein [Gemmatimonadota bacterium]|nr:TIGR02206 family membrane protein [Gemmatimonadota bacterium]
MAALPEFELFGASHMVAMAAMVAVPVALSLLVRRRDSERVTRVVCVVFATVMLVNQTVYWVFRFVTEGAGTFVREHLPLHVCGMTVLLSVATLLWRRRWTYELLYFWGLAGATNAMVTPELAEGFPHYVFFQYFISHGGIVGAAVFATWGLGMRPTFRSLVRAFVAMNAMAVVMACVNLLLGSNYMYLCEVPETASPFLFLPWPWYILWLEVLALVFFGLLYLPVLKIRLSSIVDINVNPD